MTERNNVVPIVTGKLEPGQHRLAFLRTDVLEYPEMWAEVYIQCDGGEERMFAEMLVKSKCYLAKSPETADFVIFGGGVDVNPILYNEKPHASVAVSSKRDEEDMKLYEFCLSNGIPMLGICRGAQFLAVMNGAKLNQDIDGHQSPHSIWDVVNRRLIGKSSSVHHQSVRRNTKIGMEILADARVSTKRWLNDKDKEEGVDYDIEAFFFRDTCCLGFQGHPEYRGYAEYTKWCLDRINEYLVVNPDLSLCRNGGRNRALPEDFLKQRDARWTDEPAADPVITDDLDDPIPEDLTGVVTEDKDETVTVH